MAFTVEDLFTDLQLAAINQERTTEELNELISGCDTIESAVELIENLALSDYDNGPYSTWFQYLDNRWSKVTFSEDVQYFSHPISKDGFDKMIKEIVETGKEAALTKYATNPIMLLYVDFAFTQSQ